MERLNKRHVGLWLPAAKAKRLQRLADQAGLDLPRAIERLIDPFLATNEETVVIAVKLDRDVYDDLVDQVQARLDAETDEDRELFLKEGVLTSIDEQPDFDDEVSGDIQTALIYSRLTTRDFRLRREQGSASFA